MGSRQLCAHMNVSTNRSQRTEWWLTYAKTGAFVLPAILAWSFSAVFLFPKLQQIWADTGFAQPAFVSMLYSANRLLSNWFPILSVILAALVLLETRVPGWARYRPLSLGMGVWVINSAVLLLITAMLLSALIAAPGLAGHDLP
jgi:type II secretory pathway component PulF